MGTKSTHKDKESTEIPKWGVGCVVAIGLPMALLGLLIAVAVATELWQWVDMQSWVETPATILESELVTDPGDDGGATFHVTAKYAYEFAGRRYENTRVGVHEGGDNLGAFHHEKADSLKKAREAGQPHPCFVNPDEPAQAVLFRELRAGIVTFKLLMALILGGAGALMSVGAIYAYRSHRRQESLKAQYPNKPWMWRNDWAAQRLRSSGNFVAWFVTFFAVVWNAAVWPICYVIWSGQRQANANEQWLLGFFPLAGAFVAVWGVYLWWRRLKWGVSELELAAVPGILGGPLAGLVHAPRGINSRDGYFLALKCIRKVESNIGGKKSTDDNIVWEREHRVPRDAASSAGGRTVIPVQIMIPYHLPSSGEENIRWMLEARAETPGVDYWAEFEVPVFKTADSSNKVRDVPSTDTLSDEEQAIDFESVVARMRAVLQRESASGARTLVFPRGRNRSMAIYSLLLLIVWTAATAYLFTTTAPWIVRGVVIVFGLLTLLSMVMNCLWRTTLEFGPQGVTRQWDIAGFSSRREFLLGKIAAIHVKRATNFGDTVYREVALESVENKTYTLVSEIPRAPDAERLAAEIRDAVGLGGETKKDRAKKSAGSIELETELPEEFRQN